MEGGGSLDEEWGRVRTTHSDMGPKMKKKTIIGNTGGESERIHFKNNWKPDAPLWHGHVFFSVSSDPVLNYKYICIFYHII